MRTGRLTGEGAGQLQNARVEIVERIGLRGLTVRLLDLHEGYPLRAIVLVGLSNFVPDEGVELPEPGAPRAGVAGA